MELGEHELQLDITCGTPNFHDSESTFLQLFP
jgi:hypothetical protein